MAHSRNGSVRAVGRGAGRMLERKALSVRLRPREVIRGLGRAGGALHGGPQGNPPQDWAGGFCVSPGVGSATSPAVTWGP